MTTSLPTKPRASMPLRRPYMAVPGLAAPKMEGQYPFAVFLLLLTNATLFVRPSEIVPALEGFPLFQILVLAGTMAATVPLFTTLHWKSLVRNPALLLVLAILPAIALSHLMNSNLYAANAGAIGFIKVLAFFCLLVALVDTPKRLRAFLTLTMITVLVMAIISMLSYFDVIQGLSGVKLDRKDGGIDLATGKKIVFSQLQAWGIFSDPNDFALVLVLAILVGVHFVFTSKSMTAKVAWAIPIVVLAFAFALTRSRGGFLSLLAGGSVWLFAKLGWKRGLAVMMLALPLAFVIFGGRQTELTLKEDSTAGSRIKLWREGITEFKHSPVFGIGEAQYAEKAGEVAHNSFLHVMTELGLIGGTCFLGAFLTTMIGAARATRRDGPKLSPQISGMAVCVLAIVVAYAFGLLSLSRPYAASTYMVLGVGGAWCAMASKENPDVVPAMGWKYAGTLLACSIGLMVALYLFVRFVAA